MLQPNDHILFIGDSITDAFRKPDEINDAYQMGNGYAFLIASQLRAQHPSANYRFSNCGISGQGLAELEARWQRDVLALRPNVVSILVGVNDTSAGLSPSASFAHTYTTLLHRTCEALPAVRFVICQPFLLRAGDISQHRIEGTRARGTALRLVARDCTAPFVPFQAVLDAACEKAPPEYWAYDGIHPTAAGHFLLAQTWLQAIESADSQISTLTVCSLKSSSVANSE